MGRRSTGSIVVFVIGILLFVLGIVLVEELLFKFLKFAIGMFLIFISIPMILGSAGWWRWTRKGKVVRIHRH